MLCVAGSDDSSNSNASEKSELCPQHQMLRWLQVRVTSRMVPSMKFQLPAPRMFTTAESHDLMRS